MNNHCGTSAGFNYRSLAVIGCLLSLMLAWAPGVYGQSFGNQWQIIALGECIGCMGIQSADLNQSGAYALVTTTDFGRRAAVLEWQDDEMVATWSSHYYMDTRIRALVTADLSGNGRTELAVLLSDGTVDVYGGESDHLERIDQLVTGYQEASDMVVADLEGDGRPSIILVGKSFFAVYDAANGERTFETQSIGGMAVKVGDVTGDGSQEVIVSSGTTSETPMGYVINGQTFEPIWTYAGGFGSRIRLADVTGDGHLEILGATVRAYGVWVESGGIAVFNPRLKTPLWQLDTELVTAFDVLDLESNGRLEIIVGTERGIDVYDAEDRSLLWSLRNPTGSGVTNLILSELAPSEHRLVYGTGHLTTAPDHLLVVDPSSRDVAWQSPRRQGRFTAALHSADGTTDVYATESQSTMMRVDASTGRVLKSAGVGSGVKPMAVYDWTGDGHDEIAVAISNGIQVVRPGSLDVLEMRWLSGQKHDMFLADLRRDADPDLLLIQNGVRILDRLSFEEKGFISGGSIATVVDCRVDEPLQIAIATWNEVRIHDGVTREEIGGIAQQLTTVLGSGDLMNNGRDELLVVSNDGILTAYDCVTREPVLSIDLDDSSVGAVAVKNVDTTRENELIVAGTHLEVRGGEHFDVIWQSPAIGPGHAGRHSSLHVRDIDGDGHMNIVVASQTGVYKYGADAPYVDFSPPTVAVFPLPGARNVGYNVPARASFSKPIEPSTLHSDNVIVTSEAGEIATDLLYDATNRTLTISPETGLWPLNVSIEITLRSQITDTLGMHLDGNRDGVAHGAADDDVKWSFETASVADTTGPAIVEVFFKRSEVWSGAPLGISVVAADTLGGGGASMVTDVRLSLPASTGDPNDLAFVIDSGHGEPVVSASIEVSTSGWPEGEHQLAIRAIDVLGNIGEVRYATVLVRKERGDDWPMFGRTASRTGYSAVDTISVPLDLAWSVSYGYRGLRPVTVADGTAYVAMQSLSNATLHALDLSDGTTRWSYPLQGATQLDPPSFAYGHLYVHFRGNAGNRFIAIDATTGDEIWEAPHGTGNIDYASPAITNGRVIAGCGTNGGICTYDAFSGSRLWHTEHEGQSKWSPAVLDTVVFAFGYGGTLTALDRESGAVRWQQFGEELAGPNLSSRMTPVVDEASQLVFAASRSHLVASKVATGEQLWSKEGMFLSAPAVDEGLVFVIDDRRLVARDKMTGDVAWTFEGDNQLLYTPVLSANYIFVSSDEHTYALDRDTRRAEWAQPVGGNLSLANGRLLVANPDGNLYVFSRATSIGTHPENVWAGDPVLHPAYPNPFIGSTVIEVDLPAPSHLSLEIFDILGRRVAVLADEVAAAGLRRFSWDAGGTATGVYFARMSAGGHSQVQKLVVTR